MSKPEKLRDLRSADLMPIRKPARRPAAHVRKPPNVAAALPAAARTLRLSRIFDSLVMRAVRRFVLRVVSNIAELAVYVSIAVAIGLASAWYMIDYGSRLTMERDGPWQRWTIAGAPGADPYTIAHFARAGWLPTSTVYAHYFLASKDSAGDALYADCEYTVSGPAPASRRWTLAAFDLAGHGIYPGAGRPVLSSSTALLGPDATMTIKLSAATSPGNWLGLSGGARMQLMLTQFGRTDRAVRSSAGAASASAPPALPSIERSGCR